MKRRTTTTVTWVQPTLVNGKAIIAGYPWLPQKDDTKSYALQQRSDNPGRFRAEVRANDYCTMISSDYGIRNRAEFQCTQRTTFDKVAGLDFMFRIKSGTPTSDWNLLSQFHHVPDSGDLGGSPPLAFELSPNDVFTVRYRSNAIKTSTDPLDVKTSTPYAKTISREQDHHLRAEVKFDWLGQGSLVVWLDGVQIVNKTGISIGFNDDYPPYPKFGIYRHRVLDTLVAEFWNITYQP